MIFFATSFTVISDNQVLKLFWLDSRNNSFQWPQPFFFFFYQSLLMINTNYWIVRRFVYVLANYFWIIDISSRPFKTTRGINKKLGETTGQHHLIISAILLAKTFSSFAQEFTQSVNRAVFPYQRIFKDKKYVIKLLQVKRTLLSC